MGAEEMSVEAEVLGTVDGQKPPAIVLLMRLAT